MMPLRKIILLPLLVLCACGTNEPETPAPLQWPTPPGMIVVGGGGDAWPSDLSVLPDGSVFAAYQQASSKKDPTFLWRGDFVKYTAQGKRQWTVNAVGSPGTSSSAFALVPCPDGKLLALSYYPFAFSQISSEGDVLWRAETRDFTNWANTAPWRATAMRDGRFAAVDKYGGGTVYTRSTDAWRPFSFSSYPGGITADFLQDVGDGTLLIGGTATAGVPFLLRFNPDTQEETFHPLAITQTLMMAGMTELRNGEVAIALADKDRASVPVMKSIIQRWSVSGALIFEHSYEDLAITSITLAADGGYILTGIRAQDRDPAGARVVKLDAAGAIQWEWSRSRATENGQHGAVFTFFITAERAIVQPDGGIVCAGTTNAYGVGTMSAWMLRLTADGRVDSTFGK